MKYSLLEKNPLFKILCLDLEATLVEDGMNKANAENDAQLVSFVLGP